MNLLLLILMGCIMKLTFENIGKIGSAKIEFNGITVIGGENNTGKSTVGKVLYGVFNSCYNIDNQIKLQKSARFRDSIRHIILSNSNSNYITVSDLINEIDDSTILELLSVAVDDPSVTYEYAREFAVKHLMHIDIDIAIESIIDPICNTIAEINKITDTEYMLARIGNYYSKLFNEQIVNFDTSLASVALETKSGMFNGTFSSNDCEWFNLNFSFTNNALFIDNPNVLDYLNNYLARGGLSLPNKELLNRLDRFLVSDTADIDRAIVNQKLEDINELIACAVPGSFDSTSITNGEQYLFKGDKKAVKISNLSAGVKAFLIIKKLLENNQFKPRDVLILDEPEINLHPAWQLIYAEVIVLLQQKFELTVLLSSHSPYFLAAIEAYAKKYKRFDKCKFYLAENKDSFSTLKDVTNNVNEIYSKLAKPLDVLEEIESDEE